MFERKTMNAEGQHERQRIGQAKCQNSGGGGSSGGSGDQRTSGNVGNTVNDDNSTRYVVETRRIKKERHFADGNNENGTVTANNNLTGGNESAAANSENGHHNSRSNSVCRTNGFHPSDMLQEIIAAKFGQSSAPGHATANKNDKIRLMIEDSLSEDSKNRVQEIFLQIEQLKIEEKLLLYLRLPASLANPGGAVDPLRQPLNPLGNRYEIHQTIMWIKTHLEEDPDVSLPKQEVYDEYNVFCIRNAMKPLSTADFGKVMKQVYPRVRPRRLGTRGNSRYCYAGMRKRVKLDTPTLPCVTDTPTTEDFEEAITEEMLGAASTLIREWAESLLKMKFSSLSALARHLVDNLRVDTRSLSAVCILSASGDSQPSSNNKVSETSPSLSVTPVAGKPGKLREAQLQLQRKLQQREQNTRDQKSRQHDAMVQNSVKEKILESPTSILSTTTAITTTTTTMTLTTTGRSSSAGKGCKKSKTNQSPQIVGTPSVVGVNVTASTGPSPKCTTSQPAAASSPASSRNRKLPRSTSQASNNNNNIIINNSNNAASPQQYCDNEQIPIAPLQLAQQQQRNDETRRNNGTSRSCTPSETPTIVREAKLTVKNSRKRSSLESNRQTSESSPEKQAKLTDPEPTDPTMTQQEATKNFAQLPPVQRVVEKVTLVVPSSGNGKIEKSEFIETTRNNRQSRTRDPDASIMEKMTNGRATVWESIAVNNRLEDKLCTIDPDALDDYLNGGNNSQEQEEELLQYFQQSNSSGSDVEAGCNQLACNNEAAERSSRSDKVSQLRLILQQNLKAGIARPCNSVESSSGGPSIRRTTPVAVLATVPETKTRDITGKQHDIVLPILLNHHSNPVTSGTRRRVSFETSVIEQQQQQQHQQHQQQQQQSQHHETTSSHLTTHTPVNTVPQSPNTRRRIFNFTPISPGPHSPINGRAASASKPNSANASPFVSPRNTPVPRSRSNLQSSGGACRARTSQKSLARSISCSVPYTSTRQHDTFVVPTSNSENPRLALSQTCLTAPRASVEVQASNINAARSIMIERHSINDDVKVLADSSAVAAATSFLTDLDHQQKQLLINYPSQENLQEIKNVYGSCLSSSSSSISTTTATTITSDISSVSIGGSNCQPAADREISELLNGVTRQHTFTSTEQMYYRSQSVPLHRMVNPTLMSPIASNSQLIGGNLHSFNNSSNSSIAPTPVPSEFNDFVSIGAHDAYLLDDVDTGFIADDQQFLMEDKESITKILNILDEEGRQSMTILPDRTNNDGDSLLDNSSLTIDLLDPLPSNDLSIQTEGIIDPAVVLDPTVDANLGKIIESRSYPNTPLPIVAGSYGATAYGNDDCNSNGSRSYPSTPLHTLHSQDIYRESNEPMLSSPTLNSLNLRSDNVDTVNDSVCRNVNDLLESNFSLGDNEPDNDDLDPLGNFDGLQDVDSLTPLFNEVAETNR